MTGRSTCASDRTTVAVLSGPADFAGWRDQARRLIGWGIAPDRVIWQVAGETGGDLFGREPQSGPAADPPADVRPPRVSAIFLELGAKAALHSDPRRFALLYRLL
ncbi:MAG: hypothetical protein J0M19_05435, partial [Sphingomonadales bacterium]|nr:hypothetical protein [Sphingomonadales bacterium]